jgi:hypothetical protein
MNTSTSGRQRLPLLLAVLLLAGVASLGSADAVGQSGGIPTRALKHATGPITALVMDGPRVVFSTDGNGVYLWNVQTGTARVVKAPAASAFPLVQEVAIAGQRVAWITRRVAGNSMETDEDLYTTSIYGTAGRALAHAYRDWGPAGPDQTTSWQWDGDWISGLAGSGSLIAVSRWTTTPNENATVETISSARLNVISAKAGRLQPIAAGEQSIVSHSVDSGRIVVLRSDGSVGFYSAAGALLKVITPSSAREIAAGGGTLVVLTKTKTLEAYNSRTGKLEHKWPVQTRAPALQGGHLQAYGRLALYSVDPTHYSRDLRIVDLTTGKSITLATRPRSASNDASVGRLGVVYALNNYKSYGGYHPSGTLVFLSRARILTDISKGQLGIRDSGARPELTGGHAT